MPSTTKKREKGTVKDRQRKEMPRYRVILHNDEHNDVYHVQGALRKVVGFDEVTCHQIMWTAHTQGKALVIECVLEMAEHYKVGLQREGLTVSIEEA